MKRLLFLLASATLLLSPIASAQEWAKARLNSSPRHHEFVEIHSNDRTLKAFVAYPEAKEKTPVVLVVHEIFGLTDWVRSLCDQLAENGIIAIAPDLLSGQTFPDDPDAAMKATSALPKAQVKANLDATASYALTKVPASNGKLAICGFCWGGGWAFVYPTDNSKLAASYSFYGTQFPDNVQNITCPVYGFYGEKDARVVAGIPKAEQLMKAAGKEYEPVIYKDAGHGFMRDGENPTSTAPNHEANVKARNEAWTRWKTLLKQL
jgi:carboxymethylenebutenolidase